MKNHPMYNPHAANQFNYQMHHQMLQQGYKKKKKGCNCGKKKQELQENQEENK
ncbi:cytochrome C oxidase subunit III [Ectobacillus antri]|uniref:Cytochrome C oxidase subunit III n=1 Tax=Ectobacillus antri TaxID=2486280 RepID=A0ABT6H3R6_9BACI|nr:cytochrome C oxidase subunit III [Ectobacillus antri]MDG4656616.1 cytochrome C oxidase subunit III [Ectobacillus antri]MDG5754021.1 cytochrome C oxidase subunit III [Ectobacillus antri]